MKAKFKKWPSIENLYNVKRALKKTKNIFELPTIHYRPKIKLDGTNAAVHIHSDGSVYTQSRNRLITTRKDNYGFASWVASKSSVFANMKLPQNVVTLYGEWCGKGIQERCSISEVDRRIFCIFGAVVASLNGNTLFMKPEALEMLLRQTQKTDPDIYVLNWLNEGWKLNFNKINELKEQVEDINKFVDAVEKCDPWVKDNFGIEGLGEGIVLYPEYSNNYSFEEYCNLMFKVKGAAHRVVNHKKGALLEPIVPEGTKEFVNLFVTENRMLQAVEEACEGEYIMRKLGPFLKWMGQDIKKESTIELEESGLVWKDVAKFINVVAKDWYREKCFSDI